MIKDIQDYQEGMLAKFTAGLPQEIVVRRLLFERTRDGDTVEQKELF